MALSWQRRAVGVGVVLVGKDKNIAAARLHHGFEALVYAQVACIHVVYAQVACIHVVYAQVHPCTYTYMLFTLRLPVYMFIGCLYMYVCMYIHIYIRVCVCVCSVCTMALSSLYKLSLPVYVNIQTIYI